MSGVAERIEPAPAAVPPAPAVEPQAPAPAAATAATPPAEDWRERRIGELTGKFKQRGEEISARDAKIAELEAQIQQLKPANPAAVVPTEEEINRRIEVEAEKRAGTLAAQQTATLEFNKQCNNAVAEGRAAFPDFDAKLGALRSTVIPGDSASEGAYWGTVSAALKSGAAPKIIYALGNDPNEAARIMALDPESRAIEIAKMSLRVDADPSDGGLSKPITPVGAKGPQHTAIDPTDPERADKLATDAWMKRRNEQVNTKRT